MWITTTKKDITKTVTTTSSRSKILLEHSWKTVNTLALKTGPKGPRLEETVASFTKKGPGTIHSSIMMCSIWMLIISQHVAARNRRSQQSCASGCSSLFYIAENSGSAAYPARAVSAAPTPPCDANVRLSVARSTHHGSWEVRWRSGTCLKSWESLTKQKLNTFVNLNVRLSVTLPRNELLCQLLGGLDSNEFHIKWRFRTHGSWKNQNPGGRFGATS